MRSEKLYPAVMILVAGISFSVAVAAFVQPASAGAKPSIVKICDNCHTEPRAMFGYFDNVSFKAKTIQVKFDDAVELVKFDEDDIKVVNAEGMTGDGDFLRDNRVEKGHEIRVDYVVEKGIKKAVRLTEKPPVRIPADMLMSTADLEKLVARGPEKGKYFLFDSRPLPRFQEGAIPTAVNLPFPDFHTLAEKLLPGDKKALIIFYCGGPTCNMSPASADKGIKLGYSNLKVYKDGIQGWSTKNYGVLSAQSLKEAWIDKDIPHVLLDVRAARESEQGFIKGAVAFPAHHNAAPLIEKLVLKKNAPIVVYDSKEGVPAVAVARELLKAGYANVNLLTGGFEAWKGAGFPLASGQLAAKVTYIPKPRPGEISLDEFKKYAAELPANVMILDVRNTDEGNSGMLKTARLIPAEEIKDRAAAEIPKDKLIVTLCSTGVRAEMAYHMLKDLGYPNVRFVNAGMEFEKNGSYKLSQD